MIITIVVAIGLCFFTMFMWYITQPIVMTVITKTMEVAVSMGITENSYLNNSVLILTNIEYWWGPLMVGAIIIVWMLVSAQARDWFSRGGNENY